MLPTAPSSAHLEIPIDMPTSVPIPSAVGQNQGYRLSEVPRFVQYTSPVLQRPNTSSPTTNLPLNLLALIVGYLDDIGDVARVTRTSRLLYYMTLPQLYQRVSLHSYAQIRYIDGKPEGYGGGAPFTMALNGLVTKNHGSLVRDFRVWGDWDEIGLEDFAKGRVPDNAMMLNTLLRVAVERMAKLRSFSWELAAKPLKTLYQGLAAREALTSLTIRFPSSRAPRPSVLIPPMLNLLVLRVSDFDPMCYPDDISLLVLHSRKLQDLRLHFSPRMRQHAEPTLSLDMFFGRCIQAGYTIKTEHFAMQNYYGSMSIGLENIFDHDCLRSGAFLDTFGGARGGSANVFLDDGWRQVPRDLKQKFHTIRFNEPAPQHVQMLENAAAGLERCYFVNDRSKASTKTGLPASPVTPEHSPAEHEVVTLGREYLYALTRKHGPTLNHLLLCDRWALTHDEVSDLVKHCTNLEQLAIGLDRPGYDVFSILLQSVPRLVAVRLLATDTFRERTKSTTKEQRLGELQKAFMTSDVGALRYVDTGDEIYKVGGLKRIVDDDGAVDLIREFIRIQPEEVQHLAIWGLDTLDIMADPSPAE